MDTGYVKLAAASPRVMVADPDKNADAVIKDFWDAVDEGAQVVAFPELFLSAYTCGDLFEMDALIFGCEEALKKILAATKGCEAVLILGMPVRSGDRLYNCAVLLQNGRILGAVPKMYLPDRKEFGEKRWFASGMEADEETVFLCGEEIPFGSLLFDLGRNIRLGVEICEDLFVPVSPGAILALSGANIIVNIAACSSSVTKDDYISDLLKTQSARCQCAYLFSSAGVGESTTDLVFAGDLAIYEGGTLVSKGERFLQEGSMIFGSVDIQKLLADRRRNDTFRDNASLFSGGVRKVMAEPLSPLKNEYFDRFIDPAPFIPEDKAELSRRCREIFSIQSAGLAKRMSHIGLKKAVVGVSGGLDSTLALLVIAETMKLLELPGENIICITMPGFGTTDHTYYNAVELARSLGAELREIDIKAACLQHMEDIGHDSNIHDITYENTQARERTQILMDIANKDNAILVGTGDLSELAMGWCTYNGDHMSMYGVNGGVPKTLMRHMVAEVAANSDERTAAVLRRVLDTPVSPELLPPDENGNIAQKTEDTIGPYELHDFFLYHLIRFGFTKEKLQFLAEQAFFEKYPPTVIAKWLDSFLRRFFNSQFKRSCLPDGPKVGSVGLSPRGDWKMPSDAGKNAFL